MVQTDKCDKKNQEISPSIHGNIGYDNGATWSCFKKIISFSSYPATQYILGGIKV